MTDEKDQTHAKHQHAALRHFYPPRFPWHPHARAWIAAEVFHLYAPGFRAYVVFAAETIGGIALVLGVQTRLVAFALVPIMIGATMVHVPNGWLFSAPGGGWEFPAFLAVAMFVQGLLGAGAFALNKKEFPLPMISAGEPKMQG